MDKRKVEEVYEENVKAVYKYLFCLTHNADLAEELTQETFIRRQKESTNSEADAKSRPGCARLEKGFGIKSWKSEKGKYRYRKP